MPRHKYISIEYTLEQRDLDDPETSTEVAREGVEVWAEQCRLKCAESSGRCALVATTYVKGVDLDVGIVCSSGRTPNDRLNFCEVWSRPLGVQSEIVTTINELQAD